MNKEQRYRVKRQFLRCSGCYGSRSGLPKDLLKAAEEGNVNKVQEYIDHHDVNAQYENECLLSRACAAGQTEVVKILLQQPNIHTNVYYEECTPLMRAARNGHTECINLIFDSPVKCDGWLQNCSKLVLADNLKKALEINSLTSSLQMLETASCEGELDVVKLILQTKHHFRKEDLRSLVLKAADRDRWDVVCEVFDRDFHEKNLLMNEVFCLTVRLRCWENTEMILHMMDKELKFELPLVQVALAGNENKLMRLLKENRYDSQTLNGTLLVVAAGGTSDQVAQILVTMKNTYTRKTYSDSLFLSASGHCAEMIHHLIYSSEASFSFIDYHQAYNALKAATKYDLHDGYALLYLEKIIEAKMKNLVT